MVSIASSKVVMRTGREMRHSWTLDGDRPEVRIGQQYHGVSSQYLTMLSGRHVLR